jgi:hypothetical protein
MNDGYEIEVVEAQREGYVTGAREASTQTQGGVAHPPERDGRVNIKTNNIPPNIPHHTPIDYSHHVSSKATTV